MKNIEKYKDKILNNIQDAQPIFCFIHTKLMKKTDCNNCITCKKKSIEWLCEKYEEPILTDEGIEFLKEHIKQSGAIAVYIKITKKVADYYDYRLEIHLETGLISIPFVEKSNLYEMFKNVEIGQDYLPEELGL